MVEAEQRRVSADPQAVHVASLRECYEHTDLQWRLAQIPEFATSRGAYFNMLDDQAAAFGPDVRREYRRFFALSRFSPLRSYPVRDYLTRLVVLAQIRNGGPGILRGVEEIQYAAFSTWAATLMGRATLALVNRDVVSVLRAIERVFRTRTIVNYAQFHVESVERDRIVTRFIDEYVYVEHAMLGALRGVADACGCDARLVADMVTPFSGTITLFLGAAR